jgi:aspartate 4-decarboxylase
MDTKDTYRTTTMAICHQRLRATVEGLGIDPKTGSSPLFAAYYGLVDLEFWLRKYLGDEVAQFVKDNYHPLDIVFRLAEEHGIVLLNGGGFAAPNWSARISFANLPSHVYDDIGRAVRGVARAYVEAHRFAQQKQQGKKAETTAKRKQPEPAH